MQKTTTFIMIRGSWSAKAEPIYGVLRTWEGKTNVVSPDGSFPQLFAEEYNTAHPDNSIKITYSE
jgi:hypothetical protein